MIFNRTDTGTGQCLGPVVNMWWNCINVQLLKESGCSTAAIDRNQEIQNNPVHIQIPVGNQQIQKSTVQTGYINFKGYNRTVISVRS